MLIFLLTATVITSAAAAALCIASGTEAQALAYQAADGLAIAAAQVRTATSLVRPDMFGYTAAACVFMTFTTTSAVRQRCFGILSNVLFVTYAIAADLHPTLLLHVALLPVNCVYLKRLLQKSWSAPGAEAAK
jgi:hypothetical protein